MISLDRQTHGTRDSHGCQLFRGELLLSDLEISSINSELVRQGVSFKFELVKTPPCSPQPSPAMLQRTSSKRPLPSVPSSLPSTRLPQKRARLDIPQNSKPVALEGWRSTLLAVCDKLLADDDMAVEREGIAYWFAKDEPPEVIDGVSSYPIGIESIRTKINDGTFTSHFQFQQDLSALTDFVFQTFSLQSTPFMVATKLRRKASELMAVAVRSIRNEEYYTIPMPTPGIVDDSDDDISTPSTPKKLSKPVPVPVKKKTAELPPTEQQLLLQRIAALEKSIEVMGKNPAVYGEGGFRAMTPEEISKLEQDISKLSDKDLKKLIDEKLKGQPGLSYDGVGADRTAVIELNKMPAKLQRNLRRFVTMKLNEMKNQPSMEKLKKLAKQDNLARQNEEMVEKILAERKKLREKQRPEQQPQTEDEEDKMDKLELARLRDLKERDDDARRILELIAMDGDGDDDSLD